MKMFSLNFLGLALMATAFLGATPAKNCCNSKKNSQCTYESKPDSSSYTQKSGKNEQCNSQRCQCSVNCKCGDHCQCGNNCACK